jgi:predicted alpha-1,2-mannosidase
VKGIQDFDAILALEEMLKPGRITTDTSAPPIRSGYHEYLKYHYIPFEQDTTAAWWVWGPASTTLEYCLADWATAQMARALHRGNDVEILSSRALWYRNLFDPATLFIRPKRKDGSWLTPFDPSATEGSGSWAGSGGPGYVEGSAWHYTWFVPHDVGGLMKLFGGAERFAAKLDSCFATGQFTINNEPDIAYPYLFTYVPGQEEKTVRYIRDIRERAFATGPSGLPGNDDCGTLSAWFVFSALGVYPDCPASGEYRIGTPLFARATIALQNKYYSGKSITFRMRGNPAAGRTKQSVRLNGSTLKEYHISHATLAKGVDVEFVITRSR